MEVKILVVDGCTSCQAAITLWQSLADEKGFALTVENANDPALSGRVEQLRLRTFPALFIDGELRAIGVQDREQALALLEPRVP